ncbi:DUF4190 domain-containing protein [Streptomyces sp. NPDC058279]|uniref:DUF4190 domain-containing protein n=1 Tax=Streptomyces sp. NPDC058279 TaxID=3346418 RepID=UPI0036E52EE8
MTDQQSPEPRDPWAPPERPSAGPDPVRPGDAAGGPAIHGHPTVAELPGAGGPPAAAAPPVYGYPAQPDPGGYGYPGAPTPAGPPGYGGAPGYGGQPGYGGAPGYGGQPPYGGPPGYPGYPTAAGYPGYGPGYPGHPQPSNGLGVAAFVLGLLSLVACFTLVGPLVFGIVAVVLGALARGKAARGEATNGGLALAGLICGAVGIVLGAALTLFLVFGPGYSSDSGDTDYHGPSSDSRTQERI